eukprot:GHRR01002738.1.p1 GENE.GHRR01002738.1~~GHRR01002738.1.p1  ORF type:complete len:145 (+),score=41.64 GHRR01002738.1:482-916(+)
MPKKIAQSSTNLWSVMRGSAAESGTPIVTVDFNYDWQDSLKPQWAAVTIQAAWRAYKSRRINSASLSRSRPASPCARASGVPASNSRMGLAAVKQGTEPKCIDSSLDQQWRWYMTKQQCHWAAWRQYSTSNGSGCNSSSSSSSR